MFRLYKQAIIRLPVQKCKNINLTLYFVNQNGHEVFYFLETYLHYFYYKAKNNVNSSVTCRRLWLI
jgi:hypothetical protein